MRLLIAHGEAASRFALREAAAGLPGIALEPVESGDGRHTVNLLTSSDAPDLAVVDWDLPGCDGPELCRQVRAGRRSRPPYIILLTRSGHPIAEGLQAGANDCVDAAAPGHEIQARIIAGRRLAALR